MESISIAIDKDRYDWLVYHKKAVGLKECIDLGIKNKDEAIVVEIIENLNESQKCNPDISNPSWGLNVDIFLDYSLNSDINKNIEQAKEIVKKIQDQDKYSPFVVDQMYKACKKRGISDVFGLSIFDFIDEALVSYYPNYSPLFIEHAVKASIEFDNHEFADRILNKYKENVNQIYRDSEYGIAQSDIAIEIFRDINEAISALENVLTYGENTLAATKLIRLYIDNKDPKSAREAYDKYIKIFTQEGGIRLGSDVLVSEGHYDKAAKMYDSLKGKPYFQEKYTGYLSYIYLKNHDFSLAKRITDDLLNKYSWSRVKHPELIINHEFAVKILGKKPNKSRLSELVDERYAKEVRAMANLLMDNEDECLKLMKELAEKRYSWVYTFESWPVAEKIMARFNRELDIMPRDLKMVES